jgi:hypothetical protein
MADIIATYCPRRASPRQLLRQRQHLFRAVEACEVTGRASFFANDWRRHVADRFHWLMIR